MSRQPYLVAVAEKWGLIVGSTFTSPEELQQQAPDVRRARILVKRCADGTSRFSDITDLARRMQETGVTHPLAVWRFRAGWQFHTLNQ